MVCSSEHGEPMIDDEAAADTLPPDSTSAASRGGAAVMLLCPTCDEAFSPRFYRWCENCGYDFGEGREGGPPEEASTNYRVVGAIVGLVAVMAGLWGYLVWLFRK